MKTWTDESLIEAVKQSDCYTVVLRRLGLSIGQAAINRIKKRIIELQLNIDHFSTQIIRNRRRRRWSDEDLRRAVRKSWSIAEVTRVLGLTVTSTNCMTVKKHIERLKLSVSHFERRIQESTRRSLKELLKKGSQIESCRLRPKILRAGLLENKCSKCGLGPEWQGKVLTLELDHINGDRYDNRLENLRILCPNCHSQTRTYGSKNRRKN